METLCTSKSESIQSVYENYVQKKYIVNRRYQRKLVWSLEEKEAFIDSIYRKYSVPLFLFAQSKPDIQQYEIIDGMQRLNAIFCFIENEFGLTINGSEKSYYANSISLNNGVKIYEGSNLSFNSAHSCSVNSKSTNNLESNTTDYDCIAIFPNPTSEQLCISSNCDNELINNIEIYSYLGVKELEYKDINDVEFIVNLNLYSGTYFIKISTSNRMVTQKIIVIK